MTFWNEKPEGRTRGCTYYVCRDAGPRVIVGYARELTVMNGPAMGQTSGSVVHFLARRSCCLQGQSYRVTQTRSISIYMRCPAKTKPKLSVPHFQRCRHTAANTTLHKAGASRRKPTGEHEIGTSLEPCRLHDIFQALGMFGLPGNSICCGGVIDGGNGGIGACLNKAIPSIRACYVRRMGVVGTTSNTSRFGVTDCKRRVRGPAAELHAADGTELGLHAPPPVSHVHGSCVRPDLRDVGYPLRAAGCTGVEHDSRRVENESPSPVLPSDGGLRRHHVRCRRSVAP